MPAANIAGDDVGDRVVAFVRFEPRLDAGDLARDESVAAVDQRAILVERDRTDEAIVRDVLDELIEVLAVEQVEQLGSRMHLKNVSPGFRLGLRGGHGANSSVSVGALPAHSAVGWRFASRNALSPGAAVVPVAELDRPRLVGRSTRLASALPWPSARGPDPSNFSGAMGRPVMAASPGRLAGSLARDGALSAGRACGTPGGPETASIVAPALPRLVRRRGAIMEPPPSLAACTGGPSGCVPGARAFSVFSRCWSRK